MSNSFLNNSRQIQSLAYNLGYQLSRNPIGDILSYCDSQIEEIMRYMPDCDSLELMLQWVASKVSTTFLTIENDDDLLTIEKKYQAKREPGFADLKGLFEDENDLGVTIILRNQEEWEPKFVSVIDCRGLKKFRAYFTKWHEIAHILTTLKVRSPVSISHASATSGVPVERLMDLIAGRLGFYAAIAKKEILGEISFELLEEMRQKLCPEASRQASLINFVKFWTSPCILVCAKLAYKKAEEAKLIQRSLFSGCEPQAELRAAHVIYSDTARETEFTIFQNTKVPVNSIIYKLFQSNLSQGEALENLSWWKSESKGTTRPNINVRVMAKRTGESVDALIIKAD